MKHTALTYGNSKLKVSKDSQHKTLIAAFDLPAGLTCPRAGECRKFCYASSGTFCFRQVREHLNANLELSERREDFISQLSEELRKHEAKAKRVGCKAAIRIHSSGDFYSKEYAEAWIQLARIFPNILFYGYTKSHVLLSQLDKPNNFIFMPSAGGLDDDKLVNKPHVRVVPEFYQPTDSEVLGSDDDLDNLNSYLQGKIICLEAHGAKKARVVA